MIELEQGNCEDVTGKTWISIAGASVGMTSVVAEKSPFAMVRATMSFELTAQVNFAGRPMRVAMTPAARRKYFKKKSQEG